MLLLVCEFNEQTVGLIFATHRDKILKKTLLHFLGMCSFFPLLYLDQISCILPSVAEGESTPDSLADSNKSFSEMVLVLCWRTARNCFSNLFLKADIHAETLKSN